MTVENPRTQANPATPYLKGASSAKREIPAYLYAQPGPDQSSTDIIFYQRSPFSEGALREAEGIMLSDEELSARPEVRGLTVDGVGTLDKDDAFSIEQDGSGYVIHVSIADGSSLIAVGGDLDTAVHERSFTRYYGNSGNDPMLPRVLSENRLSLHQGVRRPTVTFSMPVDRHLHFGTTDIRRTVLTSRRALTYPEADLIIQEGSDPESAELRTAFAISMALASGRHTQYDFERMVEISEEGEERQINWGEGYQSMILVRELMIKANMAAARYAFLHDIPTLFRVHDALGLPAYYSTEYTGHAGLGLGPDNPYAHVTSDLRREADLIFHRQVLAFVEGNPTPHTIQELRKISERINAASEYDKSGRARVLFFKMMVDEQVRQALAEGRSVGGLVPRRVIRVATQGGGLDKIRDWILERLAAKKLGPRDIGPLLFSSNTDVVTLSLINQVLGQYPEIAREALYEFLIEKGLKPPEFLVESRGTGESRYNVSIARIKLGRASVTSDLTPGSTAADAKARSAANLIIKARKKKQFKPYLE